MPKVKRQPSSEDEEASNSGSGSDAPSPPPAKKGKTAEKTKAKPKKDDSSSDSGPDDMEPAPMKAKSSSKKSGSSSSSSRGADNNTWTLERNRLVKINEFRGRVSVDIREHYEKDGQLLPGKKGISLNAKEWDKLKQIIPEIDKALKNY